MDNNPHLHPAFKERFAQFTAQHPHNDKPFVVAFIQTSLMSVNKCDLDVKQAVELRDWLNRVLP